MTPSSIDAARALMPSWVIWLGIAWVPGLTFVLSSAVTYLCARAMLFWTSGIFSSSWTQRARAAFPLRYAKSRAPALCLGFVIVFLIDHQNPLAEIPLAGVVGLSFPAMILASVVVDHMIAPRIGDPLRTWSQLFRSLATAWMLSPTWLIVAATLFAMPADLGPRAVAVATLGLITLIAASTLGTMSLLLRIRLASIASPRVMAAASEASRAMAVTPSAVYEVDLAAANAFALIFPKQIVFTRRAVEVLDHKHLVAVCCHELAHLAEPARVQWMRVAGSLVIFLIAFSNPIYGRFGMQGIFGMIAVFALAYSRISSLRRRMERRADTAAHHNEPDEGVYARALERLYMANNVPAVLPYRRAHGNLYDRMLQAGVTPNYERPAPPALRWSYVAMAGCLAFLVLLQVSFDRWSDRPAAWRHFTETGIMWRLAIGAAGPSALAQLADFRSLDGRIEQAATFYRAASEIDPTSVIYPARLATMLSALGRCTEATDALSDAEDNLNYDSSDEPGASSAAGTAKSAVGKCAHLSSRQIAR